MVGIPVPIDASAINRRLTAMEERIRSMEGARSLSAATISDGGLTIRDGGDLTIRDGGELHVDGLAAFGGDMRVTGTLSLPAGIIDNDALANPLVFRQGEQRASNFSIATSEFVVASFTVEVPPGFTQATATAIGSIYASNSTANLDYLYARVRVASPAVTGTGIQLITPLTALNGSGALTVAHHAALTGLAGGQLLTVSLRIQSGFVNLPASPQMRASCSAAIIFVR